MIMKEEKNWMPRIIKLQRMDVKCKEIMEEVKRGNDSNYYMEGDILYKRGTGREINQNKLVIPEGMKEEILNAYHNNIMVGHLGRKKTVKRIAQRYYWPGMRKDIYEWINTCMDCQMRKDEANMKAGSSGNLLSSEPFELIGISRKTICKRADQ